MTVEEIKERIEEIEKYKEDPETAHFLEDELYWDFVYYVERTAQGDLRRKASLVLKSKAIEFPRWAA